MNWKDRAASTLRRTNPLWATLAPGTLSSTAAHTLRRLGHPFHGTTIARRTGPAIACFAAIAHNSTVPRGKEACDQKAAAREPVWVWFEEAYPQPKDGARRAAPFVPYLAWTPPDFALSLSFAGGGIYFAGRLMFDADGNLWSGQNWMPGSQSGVIRSIGGGVIKITPNGAPLSPPITGFTGMGIDGVGWGTAVTRDNVWVTSFNGKILVMDFDGHPIGSESDFPFKEKLTGLEGQANGVIASLTEGVRYLLYNSVEDRQIPEKNVQHTAALYPHVGTLRPRRLLAGWFDLPFGVAQ
jgi:hypothetical protein